MSHNNFITIGNGERAATQMLQSPPEGMQAREWFMNVEEAAQTVSYDVTGYVEEVVINGTSKLVLRDDGPGMSPTPKKGVEFDLTTFMKTIAVSGESRDQSIHGNQGRGFRFAWSKFNPAGIIVLSKIEGGETYEAKWWYDRTVDRYRYDLPVLTKKPLVDLGDHGTAFIMLGQDAQHDTAADPFDGWEDYARGKTSLFPALLVRRFDKPKAKCRVASKTMLNSDMNWQGNINFFGCNDVPSLKRHWTSKLPTDIRLEWIEHKGKRFEEKGTAYGGTNLRSFATIVFEGEMFDFCEHDEWHVIADGIGDLKFAAEHVSVRIHLGPSWKSRIHQHYERTKLEWQSGMRDMKRPCRRGKAYGANVVAIATFTRELTSQPHYPEFLKKLIAAKKVEANDAAKDKFLKEWEKLFDDFRIRAKPKGKGPQRNGEPYIFPLPGAPDGGNNPGNDDFFDKGILLDCEIVQMHGEHKQRYPVMFREDIHTNNWTLSLSKESSYVLDALNLATKVFTKKWNKPVETFSELALVDLDACEKVLLATQRAACLTIGKHLLWTKLHETKKQFTEEDVERALTDQPGATLAMQRMDDWMTTIPKWVEIGRSVNLSVVA